MNEATYPIPLHLRGRGVLVVGGDRIEMWASERLVMLERRPARASDVDDAFIVIGATDDAEVNAMMASAAPARDESRGRVGASLGSES